MKGLKLKLCSDYELKKTPHTWPLRASYGVSFVCYSGKSDRGVSEA